MEGGRKSGRSRILSNACDVAVTASPHDNRKREAFAHNKKGYKPKHVTFDLLLNSLGWLMGLEPTTTGITILDSTN
jgi:hypothetical protein